MDCEQFLITTNLNDINQFCINPTVTDSILSQFFAKRSADSLDKCISNPSLSVRKFRETYHEQLIKLRDKFLTRYDYFAGRMSNSSDHDEHYYFLNLGALYLALEDYEQACRFFGIANQRSSIRKSETDSYSQTIILLLATCFELTGNADGLGELCSGSSLLELSQAATAERERILVRQEGRTIFPSAIAVEHKMPAPEPLIDLNDNSDYSRVALYMKLRLTPAEESLRTFESFSQYCFADLNPLDNWHLYLSGIEQLQDNGWLGRERRNPGFIEAQTAVYSFIRDYGDKEVDEAAIWEIHALGMNELKEETTSVSSGSNNMTGLLIREILDEYNAGMRALKDGLESYLDMLYLIVNCVQKIQILYPFSHENRGITHALLNLLLLQNRLPPVILRNSTVFYGFLPEHLVVAVLEGMQNFIYVKRYGAYPEGRTTAKIIADAIEQAKTNPDKFPCLEFDFLSAAAQGNTALLKEYIRQGMDPACTTFGNTALHVAAFYGQIDCVRELLLTRPGMINMLGQDGATALYMAASKGHDEIVNYLHQHGATITNQSVYSFTAAQIAAEHGHNNLAKSLKALESEADENQPASGTNFPKLMKFLVFVPNQNELSALDRVNEFLSDRVERPDISIFGPAFFLLKHRAKHIMHSHVLRKYLVSYLLKAIKTDGITYDSLTDQQLKTLYDFIKTEAISLGEDTQSKEPPLETLFLQKYLAEKIKGTLDWHFLFIEVRAVVKPATGVPLTNVKAMEWLVNNNHTLTVIIDQWYRWHPWSELDGPLNLMNQLKKYHKDCFDLFSHHIFSTLMNDVNLKRSLKTSFDLVRFYRALPPDLKPQLFSKVKSQSDVFNECLKGSFDFVKMAELSAEINHALYNLLLTDSAVLKKMINNNYTYREIMTLYKNFPERKAALHARLLEVYSDKPIAGVTDVGLATSRFSVRSASPPESSLPGFFGMDSWEESSIQESIQKIKEHAKEMLQVRHRPFSSSESNLGWLLSISNGCEQFERHVLSVVFDSPELMETHFRIATDYEMIANKYPDLKSPLFATLMEDTNLKRVLKSVLDFIKLYTIFDFPEQRVQLYFMVMGQSEVFNKCLKDSVDFVEMAGLSAELNDALFDLLLTDSTVLQKMINNKDNYRQIMTFYKNFPERTTALHARLLEVYSDKPIAGVTDVDFATSMLPSTRSSSSSVWSWLAFFGRGSPVSLDEALGEDLTQPGLVSVKKC